MGPDDFLMVGQFGLKTAMFICAPVLVFGLIAGLAISIFQAASQINDASLAFIPKIGAAMLGIMVFGPFMLNRLAAFTIWVYQQIPAIAH